VVHLIPWRGTEKAREVQTESTPPKAQQKKTAGAAWRELRGFKFELGSLSPLGQRAVGLVIAVGIANFLAEWLGLALRPQVGGVIILCPSAGIAVGASIVFGPSARMPIATSVAIATAASSIMFGKGPWVAVAFGLVNAGQALLATWLIERWFGDDFKLENVPQVLGFLVASAIGVAIGATGAAVAKTFAEPIAFLYAWQLWFAPCLLGALTIAPLLIGLGELPRELPPRRELIEGTVAFVISALLSVFLIFLPQAPRDSALPVVLVLPVLLWLAVRCRPLFAAAAASVLGVTIVWSTAFQTGHFGDASIPLGDRILTAQTYVLAGSLLALILAALFAERRLREALLKAGNEQLRTQKETFRRLLGSLPAAIYTTDKAGRITYCNQAAVDLWGTRPELGKDRWSDLWRLRYSDGTPVPLDDRPTQIVLNEGRAVRGREALFERPNGTLVPIMPCPAPLFDEQGRVIGVVNMQIDLTERKQAEAVVKESESRLADGLAAGHVIAFDWNAVTGLTQRSDNATDVLGFDQDELTGSPRNIFLNHIHPDDRTRLKQCIRALRPGMPSYGLTFRYVRPDDRLVWLEEAGKGEFDATGKLLRVKGLTRNITDRKQAEDALAERNAQLALAGRAGRVGSYAYDVNKGVMQISEGYAAIHGLPAGTTETSLCEWRSRVHPDDLRRVEAFRDQVFANRQKESNIEYRIVRSDGEMRWVERRSSVSYDADGHPTRVAGVSIDVTERKGAEERQRVLVAELDHRVKNALATVSCIVSHTGVGNRSVADFVAALEGRLRSMAATHELLGALYWRGVSLKELVRRELAPYAARNNTEVSGDEVFLRAEAGQAMAMVLHELATNAAKYGALSTKEGRVSIRSDQRLNGRGHRPPLVFEWRESGGPPVVAPNNPGYGTSTIRDLIPYEFGGTVALVFAQEGIRCRVELPANWLSSGRELVSDAPEVPDLRPAT
jgi:PAS domain S-box-containing protein